MSLLHNMAIPNDDRGNILKVVERQEIGAKRKQIASEIVSTNTPERPYGKTIQLKNLRKGVPGEWKKEFKREDGALMDDLFHEIMVELGYLNEGDHEWYKKLPSAEQAIEKILTVFDGPSVQALTRRVRVLYNLAKDRKNGEIVELGTHHGYGAFALAYGARGIDGRYATVFTVDDYTEKKGWAGEHYGYEDFSKFNEKLRKLKLTSNIVLIKNNALDAIDMFNDGDVGLLYIDTGQVDVLPKIFAAWENKVMPDGIVALRDTLTRSLRCDKIAANAVLSGKFTLIESPPGAASAAFLPSSSTDAQRR